MPQTILKIHVYCKQRSNVDASNYGHRIKGGRKTQWS